MILNLLPPAYRDAQLRKAHWQRWQQAAIMILVVAGLSAAATFGSIQWQAQRIGHLDTQLQNIEALAAASKKGNVATVTQTLNNTIKKFDGIVDHPRSWNHDLSVLLGIFPAEVTIQKISLNAAGDVHVEGTATTRASFLTLDETLKKSPLLKSVATNSTPSKRNNLPYIYSAIFAQ